MQNPFAVLWSKARQLEHRSVPVVAWITLIAGLSVTAVTWRVVHTGVQDGAHHDFLRAAESVTDAVKQRMIAYEQALHGGVGLFLAAGEVTREGWRTYVNALHIEENYPGIQGIGYALRLRPEQVAEHERSIRREGFPNYHLKPAGRRDEYTAIVYLEPFDVRNRRAFGYDMFSEPTRHAAMVRARDSGQATLSGRVILKQEMSRDIQAGFLLYLPLYRRNAEVATVAQRREALVGYVYSPFRANDLMRGILGSGRSDMVLQIYDGESTARRDLLFETQPDDAPLSAAPLFTQLRTLQMQGRPWTLRIRSTPIFESRIDSSKANIVAALGLTCSVLVFAFVWSLATLRKRALALADRMTGRLRERETFISAMVDNAADGIITVDQECRILSFNRAAETIFGYQAHEAVGNDVATLTTEPLKHDITDPSSAADDRPVSARVGKEVTGKRRDGSAFPLDIAISAINRESPIYVWLVRDITDRKEAERALRRSEERFELAIRGANDGLWDWDLGADRVYFSPRWKAILGYAEHELGDSAAELRQRVHPQDATAAAERLRAHWEGQTLQYQSEHRLRHKDGHYVWVHDRGLVQRDERGHAYRMVGILSDITERKQVERLKSEFVSVVSHELRTPLTSIRGSLGLLTGGAMGELPDSAHDLLEIAGRNTERLLMLINDILDIEKMQSGTLPLRVKTVGISDIVEQAIDANRGYADEFNVSIALSCTADEALVAVDIERFTQIMANLLSNAAKFSREGSTVCVDISADAGRVRVSVRDEGDGIPEEFRPRVFEKFSQADSSDARHRAGTGLGMSITRALVEKMNGTIDFETQLGVGTTFHVMFPRVYAEIVLPESQAQ